MIGGVLTLEVLKIIFPLFPPAFHPSEDITWPTVWHLVKDSLQYIKRCSTNEAYV